MTTRSGCQYILSSTTVTSTNPVTPVSSPKWSHKELFGPLGLPNTQGGYMIYPRRSSPGYLSFQGKMDPMATLIGPTSVMHSSFTNPDKNTPMSF
jgi:hypothetical protein